MREIYWLDLPNPGNRYLVKMRREMLFGTYFMRKRIFKRFHPQLKHRIQEVVLAKYDRFYVTSKIATDIIEPLGVNNLPELLDIVTEAWITTQSQKRAS